MSRPVDHPFFVSLGARSLLLPAACALVLAACGADGDRGAGVTDASTSAIDELPPTIQTSEGDTPRLVFLAPKEGARFTCDADDDGTLGRFGPIHVKVQVLDDKSRRVKRLTFESSVGAPLYFLGEVREGPGYRYAEGDVLTGWRDGVSSVGLRATVDPLDGVVADPGEVVVVEEIHACLGPKGYLCSTSACP